MKYLPDLFERNRKWAARQVAREANFFERLCDIQQPEYLWIGCSDSRVPANEIVDLAPGEMFVHRNIANLVVPEDTNCMAVVQYAIDVLHVRHVIVTGHYGCGGVRAALEGMAAGDHVDRWLGPLRDIANAHSSELRAIDDVSQRWRRLCELNVATQVRRLLNSDVVTQAAARGIVLDIHGWIYDLHDGLLRDLGVTTQVGVR